MKYFGVPLFLSLLMIIGAVVGFRYIEQKFEQYSGNGFSSLAPVKHSEEVEIAGTIIEGDSIDLKEVISINEPKVVQIEGENGNLGSGFLYNQKGDLITNAHIVGEVSEVLVRTSGGETYNGVVIGASEVVDVAVVRVDKLKGREPVNIAREYEAEVGDNVVAIGSPRGYQNTVTTGIVSAVNRSFSLPPYQFVNAYQISAPIAPGSSGGPLLLATTGEVIGINSAAYQGEVIGFSIPVKNIWSLVSAWSNDEEPKEPLSYHRVTLTDDGARNLVHSFYESISTQDFVTAYSNLGSEWQSSTTYEEFQANFQTVVAVEVTGIESGIFGGVAEVAAEIVAYEITETGDYLESTHEVHFEIRIENDLFKIIKTDTL